MKRVLFATLLCLALAAPAVADEGTNVPIQFTFWGYIGDAPAGVTPLWKWTVGNEGKTYTLQVVKTQVLSDSVLPQDIDEWVKPFKPNFTLGGDFQAIKDFTTTKAGQKVAVTGNLLRYGGDTRILMLNTVTPADDKK